MLHDNLGATVNADLDALHPAALALRKARADFADAIRAEVEGGEKWCSIAAAFGYATSASAIRAARSMGITWAKRPTGPRRLGRV